VKEALPPDLQSLADELSALDADARELAAGLDEARGSWQPDGGRGWSVAQCLDHLAVANAAYLEPIEAALRSARERGRWRRGPVAPGACAALFIRSLEPPVRWRVPNPRSITPAPAPPLPEALSGFLRSQEGVRGALRSAAGLDLSVRFVNPFVPSLRFRVRAGFSIIAAHGRRHVWQARRVLAADGFPGP
jgi:hypothetical protein